jgi:hypothetical protein
MPAGREHKRTAATHAARSEWNIAKSVWLVVIKEPLVFKMTRQKPNLYSSLAL